MPHGDILQVPADAGDVAMRVMEEIVGTKK